MKRLLTLAILCATLFAAGCSSSDEGQMPVIDLEKALGNIESVNLSSIASDIEYIPIETADSALMGNAVNIAIHENYIFIGSTQKQKTIHVFTPEGKFLRNVGSKGRAKGEYIAIKDLIPISNQKAVMVIGGKKLVTYSAEDGAVIQDIEIDEVVPQMEDTTASDPKEYSITYDNSGYFWAREVNNKNLSQRCIKLDASLHPVTEFKLKDAFKSAVEVDMGGRKAVLPWWLYSCNINCMENNAYAHFFPADTLYKITDGKLVPEISVDYGTLKGNYKEKVSLDDLWIMDITHLTPNLVKLGVRVPQSRGNYPDKSNVVKLLYNKEQNKSCILEYSNVIGSAAFTNDLDGGMPFYPVTYYNNKMYMCVDAGVFIEMSQKYNSPKMKEVAAQLTEESNPVIVAVTLK